MIKNAPKNDVLEDYSAMLRGMLSPMWQKPSARKIERLLKSIEDSKSAEPAALLASGAPSETLADLSTRVRADHHHGGLSQLSSQLPREAVPSLKENIAVHVPGGKDLDDVGSLDLPIPEAESLREGGPNELGTRQGCQGSPEGLVAEPFAGLIREVGPHVEAHGAGGVIGHTSTLHDLKQRRKFRSNHFYLYFEADRGDGHVAIETAWLPDLRPVREQLEPLGFIRNEQGTWRARATLDDFMGVSRRVARALELLIAEASGGIDSDE